LINEKYHKKEREQRKKQQVKNNLTKTELLGKKNADFR